MTMMIMVTMVRISVTPVLKTLRLICQKLSKSFEKYFRVQSSLDFTLGRLQSARAVRGQKEQVWTTIKNGIIWEFYQIGAPPPSLFGNFGLILQSFSWLFRLDRAVEIRSLKMGRPPLPILEREKNLVSYASSSTTLKRRKFCS